MLRYRRQKEKKKEIQQLIKNEAKKNRAKALEKRSVKREEQEHHKVIEESILNRTTLSFCNH